MRGLGLFALIAVVVLLIGATAVLFRKYEKSSADFAESQTRYNEAINAIAEIQDSLFAITPGDSALGLPTAGLQTEQSLTEPQTRQALDRIAVINKSIVRTKERIHELEGRLQKSGVRVAGLQRLITSLKQSVAEKETMVAELNGRVDSLQVQVVSLEGAVAQGQETIRAKEQTLEERRSELATIYLLMGTKKELSASGVIVSRGGFLGMGKTVTLTGRYDESQFSRLDTDQERLVRTPSPKARVLSAQPASSYELKLEGEQMELHILDPKEFRKVRHLVILTG
jgi:DNA repair exonuclease SbcCD ATPase subunit